MSTISKSQNFEISTSYILTAIELVLQSVPLIELQTSYDFHNLLEATKQTTGNIRKQVLLDHTLCSFHMIHN